MDKKIMLITGTRKGIGRGLAEHYLDKGYTIIGCSRGSNELYHENYEHYELDVSDEKSVKKMVNDVFKKFKKIDILINNAGMASMNHVFLTPLSTVEKVFKTNFFGTFLFSREVSKIMSRQKYGRIINTTTVAVPLKIEGEAVYAASKSAIETFTKVIAKELASFNITCNCIGPSPVYTDLIKSVPEDKIQNIVDDLSIHRLGEFNDVINIINFLIKEESNYITGQTIYLGGA